RRPGLGLRRGRRGEAALKPLGNRRVEQRGWLLHRQNGSWKANRGYVSDLMRLHRQTPPAPQKLARPSGGGRQRIDRFLAAAMSTVEYSLFKCIEEGSSIGDRIKRMLD